MHASPHSAESKTRISAALKGRRLSPEHVERQAAAHRGLVKSREARVQTSSKLIGPDPTHGGRRPRAADGVCGYSALHDWIRSKRGPAREQTCAQADSTCKGPMHWANISGEYRRDLDDFMPLCQSHHRRHDRSAVA